MDPFYPESSCSSFGSTGTSKSKTLASTSRSKASASTSQSSGRARSSGARSVKNRDEDGTKKSKQKPRRSSRGRVVNEKLYDDSFIKLCPFCNSSFSSQLCLDQHVRSQHQTNRVGRDAESGSENDFVIDPSASSQNEDDGNHLEVETVNNSVITDTEFYSINGRRSLGAEKFPFREVEPDFGGFIAELKSLPAKPPRPRDPNQREFWIGSHTLAEIEALEEKSRFLPSAMSTGRDSLTYVPSDSEGDEDSAPEPDDRFLEQMKSKLEEDPEMVYLNTEFADEGGERREEDTDFEFIPSISLPSVSGDSSALNVSREERGIPSVEALDEELEAEARRACESISLEAYSFEGDDIECFGDVCRTDEFQGDQAAFEVKSLDAEETPTYLELGGQDSNSADADQPLEIVYECLHRPDRRATVNSLRSAEVMRQRTRLAALDDIRQLGYGSVELSEIQPDRFDLRRDRFEDFVSEYLPELFPPVFTTHRALPPAPTPRFTCSLTMVPFNPSMSASNSHNLGQTHSFVHYPTAEPPCYQPPISFSYPQTNSNFFRTSLPTPSPSPTSIMSSSQGCFVEDYPIGADPSGYKYIYETPEFTVQSSNPQTAINLNHFASELSESAKWSLTPCNECPCR